MGTEVNGALIDLRDVVKAYKAGVARDAGQRARGVVVRVTKSPLRRYATFGRLNRPRATRPSRRDKAEMSKCNAIPFPAC